MKLLLINGVKITVGTIVQVGIYPQYAAGRKGQILRYEKDGRWLVRLNKIPLIDGNEEIILSLCESEFILADVNPLSDISDKIFSMNYFKKNRGTVESFYIS